MINRNILFTAGSALTDNKIAVMPIIEIVGDHRVLVENHCGVQEYGCDKISVNVKYGTLCISGEDLTLAQMTQEQLVICGKIFGISLIRRTVK